MTDIRGHLIGTPITTTYKENEPYLPYECSGEEQKLLNVDSREEGEVNSLSPSWGVIIDTPEVDTHVLY